MLNYLWSVSYLTERLQIRRIPKLTTGQIQSLDVYGFRPYKHFVRRVSDLIVSPQLDVVLRSRDNIIKMQSLTHNQMSSPRYQEMFKYGWYKAGYLAAHPAIFQTPVQYRFLSSLGKCETDMCDERAFLRCRWCSKKMCFKDFLLRHVQGIINAMPLQVFILISFNEKCNGIIHGERDIYVLCVCTISPLSPPNTVFSLAQVRHL